MSEELAQDEDDAAEDYEFSTLRNRDIEDEEEAIGRAHGARQEPPGGDVVFEIGEQDSDDDDDSRKRNGGGAIRLSGEDHERSGLMNGRAKDD